ncbi:hypothetical protein [Elizabethkingia meningoseptica]|uniref:hypothetical protein n=1 Tax=Elizabethkingia meningoseptica TaxID=238 RepID=UPI0023B0E90B|nr:hypothetical protein [Elizabethkingia meningoseptica]MDE5526642.1 hypothetical protein [Elizabethkingia meningoseptica]
MENKLIPMTTFVLEQAKSPIHRIDVAFNCIKYAKFLLQPLTLGMFIPVDENNVPLEFIEYEAWTGSDEEYNEYTHKYFEAKNKVLFEGFEFMHSYEEFWTFKHKDNFEMFVPMNTTIEKLIQKNIEITLTASAIKSIYGS